MPEPGKDIIRIDAMNEQAWSWRYSDASKALEQAKQAHKQSEVIGYERGVAYARLYEGVCAFLRSQEQDSMLLDLTASLHYFDHTQEALGQLRALNYLGNVYDTYGQYDKGLEACQRGLKIGQSIGNQEGLADILSTTGTIYFRIADYDHALESYQKSMHIREAIPDLKAVASSLNMIARTYTAKGDFKNGLDYYWKSINLREELKEMGALPWSYLGLASLYEKQQDPEKALFYYQHCQTLNTGDKDKRLALYCLLGFANHALAMSDPARGIEKLEKAKQIADALQAKPLLYEIHSLFSALYEQQGNAKEALNHFRAFHALKEEVLNAESGNRLKNQQIAFAVERSEQEAEIHRLKNVELKSAYDSIEEKNKDITASINYAQRIQQAILPRPGVLQKTAPDSFIFFQPKDIVSGDFYWIDQRDNACYIAAVDCTGHGVPGAFMSMLGYEKLNEALMKSREAGEILRQLNQGMKKALGQSGQEGETRDGMDIALLHFSSASGKTRLQYAGANRPLWILRKGADAMEEIKATKVAIGGYTPDEQQFETHLFEMKTGDIVYVFSDGYSDQFGKGGKKLKSSKWKEVLLSIRNLSMKEQGAFLANYLKEWKEEQEQTDDVLVIGIRF